LKKMFNRECGNVDAYKCGKEFLKKFQMPVKPELKKIMEGFRCEQCEILESSGHDSLVERIVHICDDKIEIKLQSSMYNYETKYTCFVYIDGAEFRVDEVEEVDDIFTADEGEWNTFFPSVKSWSVKLVQTN
jgi:hypothetical protein